MKRIDKLVEPTIQLEFTYREVRLLRAALWFAFACGDFKTDNFDVDDALTAYRELEEITGEVGAAGK